MGVQIQGDTGNVIATKGTYSGNVTIGGTLTYEDVTNVDSVGVITARSGIDAASNLLLKTGGTERLRITSGGSVGIGTDDPQQDIHILKDGLSRVRIETTSASQNADIIFHDPDGLQGVVGYNATKSSIDVDFRNTTDAITFSRSGSEKLRIDSSGKIGIATASPTGYLSVGKVGAYLNADGITVTNPHTSGLKNGIFVLTEGGYNATTSYRAAAFKAVGTSGFGIGISTDQGSNGLGGTLNYSMTFDGKSSQDGSITANGSFYLEEDPIRGSNTIDKTITFNRRGVFLMLINLSLGTTTTEFSRNIYSLGLFTARSNGATWTAIQQDLTSTHVGNFTISDAGSSGQLRVQKSAGSDARICAFRIDVLSTADVQITVTDT